MVVNLADADPRVEPNVNATFRSVHAVLPHIVERKSGDVVISTVRDLVIMPNGTDL